MSLPVLFAVLIAVGGLLLGLLLAWLGARIQ